MDLVLSAEPQDAPIEQLVVERAERQPIVQVIRAVKIDPPDVGSLDTDGRASQRCVESAEGTRLLPILKDATPPLGTPFCATRGSLCA